MSSDMPPSAHGTPTGNRGLLWTGRVITVLTAAMLIISGIMKLVMSGPEFEEGLDHLGLPMSMIVPLAILEIACAVIYLIPATSVLGAILLSGYMGGAICTHWRVGDPFIVQIVLAIFVWIGIYLREPRLRALIPLRQGASGPA